MIIPLSLLKQRYFLAFTIRPLFVNSFFISSTVGKMPKPGYYAVRVGKVPGIYTTWKDCEIQVKSFPNAVFKKFPTLELAKNFLNESTTVIKQVQPVINVQKQSATPHTYEVDSEIFDVLNESNFFNNSGFDEGLVPVINSASELSIFTPTISYPSTSKGNFYAVHRGIRPGIYRTWTECAAQIKDFANASYRKFDNEQEAEEYVRTGGIQKASKRELRDLDVSNKVIKKRRLDRSTDCDFVLENPDEPVVIFTDGASSQNGRRTSRAGIGVYWGHNHPLNTSKRITGRQTNNRAEIYAAVHALNQAKQIGAKKVKLYTDSQFVIHAITDWINKWKVNGWKLCNGGDVVNKEDFIALDSAREGLDVEWIYVKAHARNRGNDEADRLAVAGSRLILEPANCTPFQNVHISANNVAEPIREPFLLSSASSSAEEILPLILPDIQEKKPFYAVRHGKNPGVYLTWTECEEQIKDFPRPCFRKFFCEEEAKEFVKTGKKGKIQLKIPECGDNEFITIFTDGASSCNGREEARAGIGVYWGPGNPLNTSMRLPGRQTNNRAEIFAAVHALRQAKQLGIKNVRIYTDSKFVINGITAWIKKWKENDWKLANGREVVNKEDFIALDDACQGLNIDWCYVRGHANIPGNVEADKLAVAGCDKSISDTIILT